ncbi:hypothetical protein K4L44_09990 [Halosquirtibacter laminarini]|uniref:Uncharacterized protein n=1 Tax=Halosquirtibacter laminarini TaxID=3374600 RepID=A0AC61NBQ4_9BACT|nr:hypothetical protein K4L44_09990 [Prolixibacteraceae bacterium]
MKFIGLLLLITFWITQPLSAMYQSGKSRSVVEKRDQSVNLKRYHAIERFGKMERSTLTNETISKYRFSSKGDTIEFSQYKIDKSSPNGKIDTLCLIRYNTHGVKVEEHKFDPQGNYVRLDYFYSPQGKVILVNQYDKSGVKTERADYFYDSMGRTLRMVKRNLKGDTLRYDEYQYYRSGTYMLKAKLKENSKKVEVHYSYDKQKRVFEKKYHVANKPVKEVFIDYGPNGKISLEKIKKGTHAPKHIQYRYDARGMCNYKRVLDTGTKKATVERYRYIYNKAGVWIHRYISIEKVEGFYDHGFIEDREFYVDGKGLQTQTPVSF